jgi:hypothetical protein
MPEVMELSRWKPTLCRDPVGTNGSDSWAPLVFRQSWEAEASFLPALASQHPGTTLALLIPNECNCDDIGKNDRAPRLFALGLHNRALPSTRCSRNRTLKLVQVNVGPAKSQNLTLPQPKCDRGHEKGR